MDEHLICIVFAANLQQELDGHDSYINCLCFDEEGSKLYTADNTGIIKIWNVYVTEKATKKGVTRDWQLSSTVDIEEMKVCNSYIYHHSIYHNSSLYQPYPVTSVCRVNRSGLCTHK